MGKKPKVISIEPGLHKELKMLATSRDVKLGEIANGIIRRWFEGEIYVVPGKGAEHGPVVEH